MKKQVRLRFLMRPIEFLPHPSDPSRLGSILCERTELKGEPGKQTAVPTGEFREIPAAMVSHDEDDEESEEEEKYGGIVR